MICSNELAKETAEVVTAAADLERLEPFQLLQRQVQQLVVEGVGGLAIVLALAEHVW